MAEYSSITIETVEDRFQATDEEINCEAISPVAISTTVTGMQTNCCPTPLSFVYLDDNLHSSLQNSPDVPYERHPNWFGSLQIDQRF
jgi:hypothetical protein